MLIKDIDRADEDVRHLRQMLALDLTEKQKFLVETEIKRLSGKGASGPSPAQILNFYCGDAPGWAVFHHLKLACNDHVERLDHLVISAYFDIVLLNSSCFFHDLKISADGDFRLFDGRQYQSIASPLDKCRRQLDLLTEVFSEQIRAPRRLGVPLKPRLRAVVLVSPTCSLIRPPTGILDSSDVVSANRFFPGLLRRQIQARRGSGGLGTLVRYCPKHTLLRIAKDLAALHRPVCLDFAAEFGFDSRVCLKDGPVDAAAQAQVVPIARPGCDPVEDHLPS